MLAAARGGDDVQGWWIGQDEVDGLTPRRAQ